MPFIQTVRNKRVVLTIRNKRVIHSGNFIFLVTSLFKKYKVWDRPDLSVEEIPAQFVTRVGCGIMNMGWLKA